MVAILMVLTSHEDMGNTGKKTGWYLPEMAHPYHVFKKAGYEMTLVSPKGGKAPLVSLLLQLLKKTFASLILNSEGFTDLKLISMQCSFPASAHMVCCP